MIKSSHSLVPLVLTLVTQVVAFTDSFQDDVPMNLRIAGGPTTYCMGGFGGSGARVYMTDCQPSNADFQWSFNAATHNWKQVSTGECLQPQYNPWDSSGNSIATARCDGSDQQKWSLYEGGYMQNWYGKKLWLGMYGSNYPTLMVLQPDSGRAAMDQQVAPRAPSPSPSPSPAPPPSPSPAPVPTPSGTSNQGLSTGAIVGIVIGSIAGVAVLGGLIYYSKRKRLPAPSMELPIEKATPMTDDSLKLEAPTPLAVSQSNVKPGNNSVPVQPFVLNPAKSLSLSPAALKVAVAPPVTPASGGISSGTVYSSSSARLTSTGKKFATVDVQVTQRYAGVELTSIGTFFPQSEDEIVLNPGDRILINQVFDDGWAFGMNTATRAEGMFPMSYCAKV